jgi:hypothetical protein
MTAETAVDVTVDEPPADDQTPARRRIKTTPLGRGERVRKVDVEIGEFEYTARCPKLIVWQDMAGIIEDQARGSRGDRRKKGDRAPAESTRVTTDRIRLTTAVSHFLRGCLTAADWQDIERDLSDPDDELDTPDLWAAGLALIVEFKPDMTIMAKSIGMKTPESIGHLADRIGDDGLLVDEPEDEPAPAPAPPRKAARKAAAKRPR